MWDFPKFDFRSMGLLRALIFHLDTKFVAKNVDRRPNYGPKSKFKMAAVRHLGILISPYIGPPTKSFRWATSACQILC